MRDSLRNYTPAMANYIDLGNGTSVNLDQVQLIKKLDDGLLFIISEDRKPKVTGEEAKKVLEALEDMNIFNIPEEEE